jgi:hypothetical protein
MGARRQFLAQLPLLPRAVFVPYSYDPGFG